MSDYSIATPQSSFKLPEGIFGSIPAMVIPYLDRRIGFHPAYWMALTILPMSAEKALDIHLIDNISENFAYLIKKYIPVRNISKKKLCMK